MTHDGHRMRMRKRFLIEGIDSFEPHEILELLLYFAIPRRDINELAHKLIDHFGNIANVLDADVYALQQVEGVGENAAVLLTLIPQLSRVYQTAKWDRNIILGDTETAGEYAKSLFIGKKNEEFAIICLDSQRRVHYSGTVVRGTVNQTEAYPRLIVSEALKHNAQNIILAHNHPSGNPRPSPEDVETTKTLVAALEAIDVYVIDHIIVGGNRFYSMTEMGTIL